MVGHLRAIRMERGLRQCDVAAAVGITEHQIRKWERGLALPPPQVLAALAKFFHVPLDELAKAQQAHSTVVEAGEGYTTARVIQQPEIRSPTLDGPPEGKLKVVDLYCGAGGLTFGLELTGGFTTVRGARPLARQSEHVQVESSPCNRTSDRHQGVPHRHPRCDLGWRRRRDWRPSMPRVLVDPPFPYPHGRRQEEFSA